MKKEQRNGSPLAGLIVVAFLLACTAGYVSALSHMFESPLFIEEESESSFLGDDTADARAAGQEKAATFQQSLGRTTAAWLINALPGYSSGRARELWYLSLDSSGDRRIAFETSGSYNPSSSSGYLVNLREFSSFTPTTGFVSRETTAPTALVGGPDAEVDWGNTGTSWTAGASWVGGVAPAPGDVAWFKALAVTSPALGTAAVSISGLYFSSTASSGYSITRTSPGAFTLTGFATSIGAETGDSTAVAIGANNTSGVNSIAVPIALAPASGTVSTFFQAAGGQLTLTSVAVVSGTGIRLDLTGTGTYSFGENTAAPNTYTGGTRILGPTVINAGTGAIFGTGTLELNSGTYKTNNTSDRTLSNLVSITGDFTFDAVSSGKNVFTGGASTTGDRLITVNTVTTSFSTNPFTLGGNLTTAGTGRLNLTGGVNLGGADRTLTAGATGAGGNIISGAIDSSAAGNKLTIQGNNFSIGSTVAGTGPVTPGATNIVNFDVNATGTISFAAANTFLGSVTVEAGIVAVNNDSGLGSSSAATAGLFMTPSSGTATVNFTSLTPAIASLSSSGAGTSNVVLGNSTNATATTLTVGGNNASTTFAGVISDKTVTNAAAIGSLTKTGAGTLTLSGNNTYTGTTTVNAGTLLVNGNQSTATGLVTVSNSGTTLGGNGIIGGAVTVNSGANLSPGSSTGIITTGSVTLNSGSNFVLELNNTTPGTGYDQLVVNGTVTLNMGNIVIAGVGALNTGDKFFVVVNDGTDAVTGTFAQGTTVSFGGDTFLINYFDDSNGGESGNDISLTLQPIPEPGTWIGAALALGALAFAKRKRSRVIS